MNQSVFNRIGPYAIERELGSGGMARVFLATDVRSNRSVALKVVRAGEDLESREILEAEQRGAELQRQFSAASQYVPHVFDVGFATGYFYIAMEYVEGEDLSTVIRRGPLPPSRAAAIAIQICRFLEEVDRVEAAVDGASRLTLLHNDLKPTNIRILSGDRVKVLDFGAAKSLSLSRRVTRNDFGSLAYLSPECLDTGERDRRTDAWALGVLLYEMAAGLPPFRADDTARLEQLIRSRRPPAALEAAPAGLRAVIAKLLAPVPDARYVDAAAIRSDLERVAAGERTQAEAEGWADPARIDVPTRRTRPPAHEDAPTRRTRIAPTDDVPTRRTRADFVTPGGELAARPNGAGLGAGAPMPSPDTTVEPAAQLPRWRRRARMAGLLAILIVCVNEGCVARQAHRAAERAPNAEFAALDPLFTEYESLASRSYLFRLGVRDLGGALVRQSKILADRVIENYRTPQPSVREAQWQAAATGLSRALALAPHDNELRGALRYAEGHLRRIDGEARTSRGEHTLAQRDFAEAVTAFREAAGLRPTWPDPFLGLARTFIYGLEDIDRGADAIAQAQRLGYPQGAREIAQLAHGYRRRGETLERAATELRGMPQERDLLTRANEALQRALDHYSRIANVGDVPGTMRGTQQRLERIKRRLDELLWD